MVPSANTPRPISSRRGVADASGSRFAGELSELYDLVPKALRGYFDLQDRLASIIAERYVKPVVIDIGLGTGITTQTIVARNPGCLVRAVENEGSMLDQARLRLKLEIAIGSVEVHDGDALTYLRQLESNSVDVVASAYTIHNLTATYRAELEFQIFKVLRPGGLFVNNDKFAADDRGEYVKELAEQIVRFDVLKDLGFDDLRKLWIQHEIEDQEPERIMWTGDALKRLGSVGFLNASIVERIGQYAIVTAVKPRIVERSTGSYSAR
jgi:tRNA (cmo5U34)-methyltransferase